MSNILLVEDDSTLAGFYRKGLVDAGYGVDVVHSCNDAIEYLMRSDAMIILLDMNLPDGSGEQVLDYIESEPAFMNLPVIILTGFTRYTSGGHRNAVLRVMTKPVTAGEIVENVDMVLAS